MMTRILGFCGCCAMAGKLAVVKAATRADSPSEMFLAKPIINSSLFLIALKFATRSRWPTVVIRHAPKCSRIDTKRPVGCSQEAGHLDAKAGKIHNARQVKYLKRFFAMTTRVVQTQNPPTFRSNSE